MRQLSRPRPTTLVAAVVGLLVLALVATSCFGRAADEGQDVGGQPSNAVDDGAGTGTGAGAGSGAAVRLTLSEGQAVAQTADDAVPVTAGTALGQAAIDAVLDRLPAFAEEEGDREAFNRPAETLPPPVAGTTVETPFGADGDDAPPAVADGPLEVLRVQPEGAVDVAPSLSITFDQPMVPLATLDQLDAADVPATISPDLPGRWRWIGTRTLRFEHGPATDADEQGEADAQDGGGLPIDRLPMATDYTVTVPAGTESATGNTLADEVTFSFSTPAPTVRSLSPQGDSLTLQPVFVVVFDQVIDPDAVLAELTLDANGDRGLRLASPAEIEADDDARQTTGQALDGRWVAFTPAESLPADTAVTITVGAGTPSAEGPATTAEDQTFTGRTFPPLRIQGTDCGFGGPCRPGQPFRITFSNPLDVAAFDPALVSVEPELPGLTVNVQGQELLIGGATESEVTYDVTIGADLADDRGQTLGEAETRSFTVGDPMPFLRRVDEAMLTLDPAAEQPSTSLVSAGHDELRVVALDVDASDWRAYLELDRYSDEIAVPDFPVLFDRVIPTGAADSDTGDENTTETILDLTEAFDQGGDDEAASGQILLYVEPVRTFPPNSEDYWNNLPTLTWVQSTHIGVDAFADGQRMVVWTTDLRDGTPIADAEVTFGTQTATTDGDGLATFDLPGGGAAAITATVDGQTALLGSDWIGRWDAQTRRDVARWHVLDDRGLYRPGETVNVKGWVRRLELTGDATLSRLADGAAVTWIAYDGQFAQIADGSAELNALGGFDLAIDLPEGANLGSGFIELQLTGSDLQDGFFGHEFQIQEFRRPEFEVDARAESTEPHVVTEPVTVAATASYLAGGPVSAAPVTWTVTQQDTSYAPPGWQGFTFGEFIPWWLPFGGGVDGGFGGGGFGGDIAFDEECCFPGAEPTVERLTGVTDASGSHYLQIDVGTDSQEEEGDGVLDQPILISANAAVEDVNRQSFAATTDLLVHAGQRYVGLRSDRSFVRQGDPLRVDAILTDIDGEVIDGEEITVTAERLVETYVDGQLTETAEDAQTCAVTTTAEPEGCTFDTEVGGRYRISSTATDADGGTNRTELITYVSGGDAVPARRVTQEQLTLIPAEREYVVGDTVEILVPAPFSPATGLVTVTRNGITSTQVVEVSDGSAVVEIELTDAMVPGIEVQVDLVGAAPRLADDGTPVPDAPDRPAYATGRLTLEVPPTSRTLTVEAVPQADAVEPGSATAVDVTVTDAAGDPVQGADLTVAVVDEAVLSLIGYALADPIDSFYGPVDGFLDSAYLRRTIELARADVVTGTEGGGVATDDEAMEEEAMSEDSAAGADAASAADGDADGGALAAPTAAIAREVGQADTPITVREDFDAIAVFAPSVSTDAQGRVTVDVDLPDSLTRYRVIAVAAAGDDLFGSDEAAITARLPLQVRPSAPRFANFGDAFELPLVLANQTDADLDAEVVLETANLDVEGPDGATTQAGRSVTVPAGDRIEVRFPITVADAGTARFRATVVGGGSADSAVVSLPVYTPTTSESFATYGVIDDGAVAQPLVTPEGVVPQFGGLEVTTSSTALQALTDAVLYLTEYRYDSSDAFASRLIAITALSDVLDAFEAEQLPPAAEIEATVVADVEGLVGLQNDDGGWPVWQRNRETSPYHTIQATQGLIAARDAGYAVPATTIDRALERLRSIEETFEPQTDAATRATLSAHALHVRNLAGDRDPAKAADVHASVMAADPDGVAPLDALAWLWPVIDDPAIDAAIEATFANQVTETPSAATFTSAYGESAHLVLASDRRTDGIVLDAFITQRPDSDLIVKIVNGLIANQRQGRWDNVQENAYILTALKRYFDTFESTDPDFVARVWLGDLYAAETPYAGRSTDSTLTVVPTAELLERDDPTVVLSKEGAGRLYYRLGLRTAPDDLALEARDEGFVVQREYAAVGDASDVVRGDDGVWRIRAGAEVRVTLTMVADSRRTNMALVDPLPAGLEPVNPSLAASPALPPAEGDADVVLPFQTSFPYGPWYDHQNLRDDRAEAFRGVLDAGTYTYSYIARATTPGTFVVPPTTAEEIYTPEVFGRTATDTVVVEG